MSRKEDYEARAEKLVTPIVTGLGCELVDVEFVKEAGSWYLRVYADKEGGITIDDCEAISRAFSELLDTEDFIDEAYIMEVSSPGLDRPLKKEKDFQRSIGKLVEVHFYKMVDGSKEIVGELKSWTKDTVTMDVRESDEDEEIIKEFNRKDISLIRLFFEW